MFTALVLGLAACGGPPTGEDAGAAAPQPPAPAPVAPSAPPPEAGASAALEAVIAGSWRAPENVARDVWRHPGPTLAFFGITPEMTVVEITPGGGWYTEILAPYLRERGRYVAAVIDPDSASSDKARAYYARSRQTLQERLAAAPEVLDRAEIVAFDLRNPVFGPPGSADAVLTFRNVHNWIGSGTAPAMFKGFFEVLRPGGVLGVVEHRAAADVPEGDRSGYLGENQVIELATQAGFVLEARSEINANPRDTRDHPNGVWTLPPTHRHDPADAAKYAAIGESDRMTLRFRKPG
ncbi:MAG: methyltransferase [Lysobacteraceae bacterium]|nr:MAG: methyltransferase [Xanthomonadaceae bacterium]